MGDLRFRKIITSECGEKIEGKNHRMLLSPNESNVVEGRKIWIEEERIQRRC